MGDYAAILLALSRGELVSAASEQDMIRSRTAVVPAGKLHGIAVPGITYKYGIGLWQELRGSSLAMLSSTGQAGTYPWLLPDKSHWGIVVRTGWPTDLARAALQLIAGSLNIAYGMDAQDVRDILKNVTFG